MTDIGFLSEKISEKMGKRRFSYQNEKNRTMLKPQTTPAPAQPWGAFGSLK
jgi:hypothetical protein